MPRSKRGTTDDSHYRDSGCVEADGPRSCLACPRAVCVLDAPSTRPGGINAEHSKRRARIRELIAAGSSWEEIMVALRVSRATISKAAKEGSSNG